MAEIGAGQWLEVTANLEAIYASTRRRATAYHFVYDIFCDWYLEITKPILNGSDEVAKTETRATAAWARDQILEAAASIHALSSPKSSGHGPRNGGPARALLIEADVARRSTGRRTIRRGAERKCVG